MYDSGFFNPGCKKLLYEAIDHLINLIRPQALSLCEAYGWPDRTLNSAIGNSYGDIYE